jgi:hypothetical protein
MNLHCDNLALVVKGNTALVHFYFQKHSIELTANVNLLILQLVLEWFAMEY